MGNQDLARPALSASNHNHSPSLCFTSRIYVLYLRANENTVSVTVTAIKEGDVGHNFYKYYRNISFENSWFVIRNARVT